MVKMARHLLLTTVISSLAFGSMVAQSRQEEEEDYFKKWLQEDVIYTITEEEKSVFNKLQTSEEKERFIEQFWARRDTTPRTSYNEFKEEHYRRIQYTNDHFASGIPGWKTDRGMIYIKYGEPDRIDSHPSGGHYQRPSWEGGGSTSTYPFEVWEYRYLEGVGQDVEIEFVDDTLTGEFRITTNPWDKDALLRMPGGGMTDAEAMGMANRVDRIVPKTSPMPWSNPLLIGYGRAKDQPFEKLQLFTNLQRPPSIDFADFRRPEVLTNIRYELLPFDVGVDYFSVDENIYLVPISVVVPHKHLDYVKEGEVRRAVIDIYGQISTVSGRVLEVFEETISTQMDASGTIENAQQSSLYQKSMQLAPGRYKLDVILHDANSEKVGTKSVGIILPKVSAEALTLSSIVLADRIDLQEEAIQASPYGPAKVFPNVSRVFKANQTLLLFYQLSNFQIDPSSRSGFLVSAAEIMQGSEKFSGEQLKIDNTNAENRDRLHLLHRFDLTGLQPGRYELHLQIQDRISEQQVERKIPFQIASSN
ncbi:GWxTD domain-containing protein [Acidobacteria bacterium AH-259-D05]|nr:GWxTD domain-containing protein [Acidobacteria bacterium AH-259-D05]